MGGWEHGEGSGAEMVWKSKKRNEKHDVSASASYRGREMHDPAHQPVCNQPSGGSSPAARDMHSELEIRWKRAAGEVLC